MCNQKKNAFEPLKKKNAFEDLSDSFGVILTLQDKIKAFM